MNYYVLHLEGEVVGMVKVDHPDAFITWQIYHPYDGAGVILTQVTEAEYSTYQSFDLFTEYMWFLRSVSMVIYDPEHFRMIEVQVEGDESGGDIRQKQVVPIWSNRRQVVPI